MRRRRKKFGGGPRYNPEDWCKNAFHCRDVEIEDGFKIKMKIKLPENKEKEIEVTIRQVELIGRDKMVVIPDYLCRRLGI